MQPHVQEPRAQRCMRCCDTKHTQEEEHQWRSHAKMMVSPPKTSETEACGNNSAVPTVAITKSREIDVLLCLCLCVRAASSGSLNGWVMMRCWLTYLVAALRPRHYNAFRKFSRVVNLQRGNTPSAMARTSEQYM